MTTPDLSKIRASLLSGASHAVVLVSWAVVYLVVVLAAMTGLIRIVTGWDAVVITSESMSPTLNPGDILFLGEHPEQAVGQQSVITFERPDGRLVTHRVFETNASDMSYVTKGDANPSPDSDIVERNQIRGVGTMVVPYLALPSIWIAETNIVALAALAIIALLAIATVVFSIARTPGDGVDANERFSATSQRGITRVRLVVALMITMLMVVGGGQFSFDAIGFTGLHSLLTVLIGLGVVSAIAAYRTSSTTGVVARRLASVELVGDTLVVLFFVAASGSSGIGWILMALPIIEAAIHFRLTGAFVHWVVMCGLTVASLLWTNRITGAPQAVAMEGLEQLIDRLGVLLLVVIPGSYLAEQLLGDVATQRRATKLARERSERIERVTRAGRDVARLGVDLFPRLVEAALELGFDVADCWTGDTSSGWSQLATGSTGDLSLPSPGTAGSAVEVTDLAEPEVFIDIDDPDEHAVTALAAAGLHTVIRITLARRDEMHVVLRCGAIALSDDPESQAMALRLLSSQAGVALQNEQLLSELRDTHAELAHQVRFDSLSELANRAHFVDVMTDALARPDLERDRITVMFLDLNGFKAVNDRLGHNAGDALLRQVAQRIAGAVGDRGLVARLGGDEFTVLLVDQDPTVAEELAEMVHERLDPTFDLDGEQVDVGASIGIATAEAGIAVSELLRRADISMYAAKVGGGARRTMRYHVELDERERRTGHLARDIDVAITSEALRLDYQPIVHSSTGVVVGVEALVRWTHEEFGPVPPPEILEAAEAADCVDALNAWIFRTALVDVASCEDAWGAEPFVALNVSPRELALPTLTQNMRAALEASGMPASRVVVELSERIVAEHLESIVNIDGLIELGLKLALDDFGEGQTSLAHLRGLPISFLKLDRLFVKNAGEAEADRTILRSVVGLAHELGFTVIAEGIESIYQHTIVAKAGAELVQGYGLHRPMPIEQLSEVLAEASPAINSFTFEELAIVMARQDQPDIASADPAPSLAELGQALTDSARGS